MIGHLRQSTSNRGSGRFAAAVAAIVLTALISHPAGAQGGFSGPGLYEIANAKSGKVLDLDRNDQTSVIQFSSRGTNNQLWDIRAAGGGFYTLRNAMNGNALEAVGTANSARVKATHFDGRSGQQWRLDAGRDGNALIVSRLGKTLDVPGGTARDGAAIQIYDTNGNSNQQFKFRPMARNANRPGTLGNANAGTTANTRGVAVNPVQRLGTGRTLLKPGWNMFSAEQDVELGQQASGEVARQVLLLNDSRVDNYLNTLGHRLSANAPGFTFPYDFKTVNDRGINAFALPGGHIYINRGVIEAAGNEAELAGVMAHEISHVALRHGTNQASKASAAQMPLAILGGMLGNNSITGALAQLGGGFTVNSILLKYSRDAERQADLMGTQILFDSGLDPRAMGQFFQKLEGGKGNAFFSDHPNPDRRIESVTEEVVRLGSRASSISSPEFAQVKLYVQSLPAPRPNHLQSQQQQNAPTAVGGISERFTSFENSVLRIDHPDNWLAYGQGDAVTIAPRDGMVNLSAGNQALAYGVVVSVYEPQSERYSQQLQGPGSRQVSETTAQQATSQLIEELRQSNQNMRVVRRAVRVDFDGQQGLSTFLSNDSPIQGAGRETNWLVTLPRPEGLLFFVFTAPEREFQSYERTFQQMLYSVRLKQ